MANLRLTAAQHNIEQKSPRGLRETLCELRDLDGDGKIQLGEFLDQMAQRGHMLVTLILCLPFMLPVPLPGLSVVLGIVIAAAGIAALLEKPPWVPALWRKREISPKLLQHIGRYGVALAAKIEHIVKPRGRAYVNHPGLRRFNGLLIAVCGLLLALPLPPGTNFPPALAIIFLSLANLEEDAFVMLVGYAAFIINILLFVGLFFLGYEGVKKILDAVFSS